MSSGPHRFPSVLRHPLPGWIFAGALLAVPMAWAIDLGAVRKAMAGGADPAAAATVPATVLPTAATSLTSAQDRLARTNATVTAIRQMQQAARELARSGANNLRADLPAVPTNSFGQANGLVLAGGVPKNLTDLKPGEIREMWTGASLPVVTTATGGTQTSTVTITQTEQQAVLNWQSFNVGKDTTLAFDQSAGGANVGRWIAFNVVRDPSARPSQILGAIRTLGAADAKGQPQVGGQVYVLNTNGIIFGGSSQVNAHALVASALPLNGNVLANGFLNNPDTQFQFTALGQAAGSRGPTAAFDPAAASADGSLPAQVSYAADGRYGDVEVQAGASLVAPTSADKVGGRIALIGANVRNAGTLSTPNGQTILAAGLQVGLAASRDPGLRGLDVYVGAQADYSGTVANGLDATHPVNGTAVPGLIDGNRGDGSVADAAVILVGRKVDQLGAIDVSTSVSLNGRIDLLAEYNAAGNPQYKPGLNFNEFLHLSGGTTPATGVVTLGTDSVTRILPETASEEKIVGTSLKLPSELNLRGLSVHLAAAADGSKGALLVAPGGQVAVEAGQWAVFNGTDSFLHSQGQIYLDAGTAIDVSGSRDITASVTDNIVEVELRGPELADYPLLREGALRGQTIQVDVRQTGTYNGRAWIGTPLADATGYVGLVQRTVGQLTTAGGSVQLKAGGSVVLGANSVVDVSGGWINYQGGEVETTKVVSDGRIYDIAQATPDRVYSGIYSGVSSTTDPKWGITTTTAASFPLRTTEAGYRQGGAGGSVAITAPAMALDGGFLGQTVAGARQRTSTGQLAKTYAGSPNLALIQAMQGVPVGSRLSLEFEQEYLVPGFSLPLLRSLTAPTVVLTDTANPSVPVAAFPTAASGKTEASLGARGLAKAEVNLHAGWLGTTATTTTGGGFGSLVVTNSEGDVLIKSSVAAAPGSSLSFDAANITIAPGVTVSAPAGSLAFTAHNFSPYAYQALIVANDPTLPAPDDKRGNFLLGKGAALVTAGLVVDDRSESPTAGLAGFFTTGFRYDSSGTEADAVSIRAYRLELGDNSKIDVSGGVSVGATGKLAYGGAGRISLLGVLDPQGATSLPIGQNPEDPLNTVARRGYLRFNAGKVRFVGYSGIGAKSGSLTLQAQQIQVENPAAVGTAADKLLASPANFDPAGTLLLAPEFFGRDGLGNYNLTGLGSVVRDASGKLVADPNGPGRRYVPGLYVAPTLTGADGNTAATTLKIEPNSWVAKVGPVRLGPVTLAPAEGQYPTAARATTSLKLQAPGITYTSSAGNVLFARGDLKAGTGSSLALDPKGSISLTAGTLQLDGTVRAPGGSITVSGAGSYQVAPGEIVDPVLPTVELGATSVLSTAGVVVPPAGLALTTGVLGEANTGSVLDGGTIAVSGNVVARKNAVVDVSGTAGSLYLLPQYSGGAPLSGFVPTWVESNGGSISLKGAQLLVSNAALRGAAGGPTAQGGSLAVGSGYYTEAVITPADVSLEITQTGPFLPTSAGSLLGRTLLDATGKPITSLGHFAAADFWNQTTASSPGGLTSLTLNGNVRFLGSVNLGAQRSLTVGTGGFLYSVPGSGTNAATVKLTAPVVTLGLPFAPPISTDGGISPPVSIFQDSSSAAFYAKPTTGPGALNVQAESLISLGSLSFQGFGNASFQTMKGGAPVAGDLVGNGTVDLAGTMSFTVGQIYPPTAVNFTLAAYDTLAADGVTVVPGSITFNPVLDANGARLLPALPLAAGGALTVYASRIVQNGVLRAPFGQVNLGWNGTGKAPTVIGGAPADLLVGPSLAAVPVTSSLTLGAKSITSVSAVDPSTGLGLAIPYGYSTDGLNWFDPTGTDITSLGPPAKRVSLSAKSVLDLAGSQVDISGGGDLYAYRWVPGAGGTADVLGSAYLPNPANPGLRSYAVLPAYTGGYAPYAPFGSKATAEGYFAGSSLATGDIIHLDLGNGQGARDYTLLPARYALLPGAYLVSAVSSVPPAGAIVQPDGSSIVAGYRTNRLSPATGTPILAAFEVALGTSATTSTDTPKPVVRTRAQYSDFSANNLFAKSSDSDTIAGWRLPRDAGYLRLASTAGGKVSFDGSVTATVPAGSAARGGLVDLSTAGDVLVTTSRATTAEIDQQVKDLGLVDPLVLRAGTLNAFGAESLLVGGSRTSSSAGAVVTVATDRIVVANASETLTGADMIFAANSALTVKKDSALTPGGTLAGTDPLIFGRVDAVTGVAVAGSGNGAMVRVSSDATATQVRYGVNQSTPVALTVEGGVKLGEANRGSVTLDSTNSSTLDANATLAGAAVALNSGQISVQFSGTNLTTTGLVLSGSSLAALQSSGASLSLQSYSSLNFYGSGQLGGATAATLALHAPEIRGDGGNVTIAAKNLLLDNRAAGLAPDVSVPGATDGTLLLHGESITLGAGNVSLQRYGSVQFTASKALEFSGTGSLATEGNLRIDTPLVTGATAAAQALSAAGTLSLTGTPSTGTSRGTGLGASLALEGASVAVANRVDLASGSLTLHSLGAAGIVVTGTLDVSGTARTFYDLAKYTDGGAITLNADEGNVQVGPTGRLNLGGAATLATDTAHRGQSVASNGGGLAVTVRRGIFNLAGTLAGTGSTAGTGATFKLDAAVVAGGDSLSRLTAALALGGFDSAQQMRFRNGDVRVDGPVLVHDFFLSADVGSITVTGDIDASGTSGGSVALTAGGAVTLADTGSIDASGEDYNSAGKGGSVSLTAGASRFDAAGARLVPGVTAAVDVQGTIALGVGRQSVAYASGDKLSFADGVTGGNTVNFSAGGVYRRTDGKLITLAAGQPVTLPMGAMVTTAGQGTVVLGGTGAGGSVAVTLADGQTTRLLPAASSAEAQAAVLADAAAGRNSGTLTLRAPLLDASGNPLTPGAANNAGVEVAVLLISGEITGASRVVVEGYRVFTPTAGIIDTVQNAVLASGTAFAAQAGTAASPGPVRNRLLAEQPGLANVLQVRPWAEIVNPASNTGTTVILAGSAANSTVFSPAGGSFTLSSLSNATSRLVSTSGTGRILLADGKTVVPFTTSSTNLALPAGAQVLLDTAGVVTFSLATVPGGTATGTLNLQNGATLSSAAGGTFATSSGSILTLSTAGQSAVTLTPGVPVVMLNNGRVRFSSAGSYRSLDGSTTPVAAAATVTVPGGAVVTLASVGSLTYQSGTPAVQLALGTGTYTVSRQVSLSPAVGDLRLQNDWNLAGYRYAGEPGGLTLRAAGNLSFNGALSDGFASAAYDAPLLAAGTKSTTYRLVAGADLSAADFRQVRPLTGLGAWEGSILVGQTGSVSGSAGSASQTKDALLGKFQVIRTGTGDITLAAGRDVLLLNPFATIYTAGTATPDPTLGATFDMPVLVQQVYDGSDPLGSAQQEFSYPAQFPLAGGDVVVSAQGDIAHKTRDGVGRLIDDSQQQLPGNWLYRRGLVDPETGKFFQGDVTKEAARLVASDTGEVKSTAWWVDYSNFFEGIGALGGGNVTLVAGRDVINVDALAPTNARMPGRDAQGEVIAPDAASLRELGGGDVTVRAGRDINGGVYYVEKGQGTLAAGRNITTNTTRRLSTNSANSPEAWLPTTLFVGKADFRVAATGELRLGPVSNPFLLPAGISNTVWNKTYFTTFDPADEIEVSSLTGSVRLSRNAPDPFLYSWLNSVQLFTGANAANTKPWLRLDENSVQAFRTVASLTPASLKVTAFNGDLNVVGDLNLAPSPTGGLELAARGAIEGLNPLSRQGTWGYGIVRLLDSDPAAFPGPANPLGSVDWAVGDITQNAQSIYTSLDGLLKEGENTENDSLPTKLARHRAGLLHAADTSPIRIYTATGDISGLGLMAGKSGRIVAGRDVTDISLMLQNNAPTDISVVGAGRDVVAFAPNSALRVEASAAGYARSNERLTGKSGRIELGGPGTLEVLAGRNLNLGVDPADAAPGIISIGSERNPRLPFGGADISAVAGLGRFYTAAAAQNQRVPGLLGSSLDFAGFIAQFLQPGTLRGSQYLPVAGAALGLAQGLPVADIATALAPGTLTEGKALALVDTFMTVLRNSGRDYNNSASPAYGTYTDGLAAIAALVPGSPVPTKEDISLGVTTTRPSGPAVGSILMPTREIKTYEGGDITVMTPSGGLTVGRATDPQKADQGILTARGGSISIFAADNVDVGTSRIFTLRGGYERIWSTWGNIAAGSGSKTVFAAPPTRVLVDAQSGDVQTDLAGLATGAGIGVLATVAGVKPDDVDLIAPVGTVDAGDAGIRSSGNLNISARVVLNAANIQVGGLSVGTPPPPPPPNLGSISAANSASAASSSAANEVSRQAQPAAQKIELPSLITVEVVGYGGGDEDGATAAESDQEPAAAVLPQPEESHGN